MIEFCTQKLTDAEKEHGIVCMDCNHDMTNDKYYIRRQTKDNVYEVVCVDCGLRKEGKKQ